VYSFNCLAEQIESSIDACNSGKVANLRSIAGTVQRCQQKQIPAESLWSPSFKAPDGITSRTRLPSNAPLRMAALYQSVRALKEELLKEFNLHTIVRLPNGVFSPYTPIPTNILFFDRSGPTKEVWYYDHPLPEGRKNYTKRAGPGCLNRICSATIWMGTQRQSGWPFWRSRREDDCRGTAITQAIFS
jgi:hypothetical protein